MAGYFGNPRDARVLAARDELRRTTYRMRCETCKEVFGEVKGKVGKSMPHVADLLLLQESRKHTREKGCAGPFTTMAEIKSQ